MKKAYVNIVRISNFEYSFSLSNQIGIKQVISALTIDNPDEFSTFRKFEKFNRQKLTFKIGMINTLLQYLDEKKIKYELTEYDYSFPDSVEVDDRMDGKYIHQKKAVKAFFEKRFGIIVVPTRGGKTFIASEILRIFLNTDNGNFCFFTDTTMLFTQAVNDINKFFERYGGVEIGEIKAGKVDTSKRVTVAMVQTVQRAFSKNNKDKKKKKQLEKYMQNLKFLCIDEIHDNCSTSKLRLFRRSKNLEYQLCLSATPYKSNNFNQNLKLKEWSGDIIYSISENTLRQRKVLSDYKVVILSIDHEKFNLNLDSEDYYGYQSKIVINNEFRNNVLFKIIEVLRELNLKTLVIFQSIKHGNLISNKTDIPFISGETKTSEREKEKDFFLKKKGGILLASNIFKKGITISQCEVLINVDGGFEDANTIQKKGRVLGTTDDKEKSLIIDFLDLYELYFSKYSSARLETYNRSVGESKIEILDTLNEEYINDFKKIVKDWFK